MADIISKIILQAKGGDDVAREIGKIKRAYQETGSAAKGMQPGTVSPAQTGVSVDQEAAAAERRRNNADLIKNKTDRTGSDLLLKEIDRIKKAFVELANAAGKVKVGGGTTDPFERSTGGGKAPADKVPGKHPDVPEPGKLPPSTSTLSAGTFTRGMTGGLQAAGQIGTGNLIGGVSSGLSTAGSMMGGMGAVGVGLSAAAIGAAVALAAGNALADKDADLRNQVMMSGLAQRLSKVKTDNTLDTDYDVTRDNLFELERAGFKTGSVSMLDTAGKAGADSRIWARTDIAGKQTTDARRIMTAAYAFGIDAGTMATTYGKLQVGGGSGRTAFLNQDVPRAAVGAWGSGRGTEFMETVNSAITQSLSRGIEKSAETFGAKAYKFFVEPLADLTNIGGATAEAAREIHSAVLRTVASADRGVASPEQAMQFMMFRKEGESYWDTVKRMTGPEAAKERFAHLQQVSGGDTETLRDMVVSEYGMNIWQADQYIKTMQGRAYRDEKAAQAQRTGTGTGVPVTSREQVLDTTLQRAGTQAEAGRLGAGLQDSAAETRRKALDWFMNAITGGEKSAEVQEMNSLLKRRGQGGSILYKDVSTDIADGSLSTDLLNNLRNIGLSEFGSRAMQGAADASYLPMSGSTDSRARSYIEKGYSDTRKNPLTAEGGVLTELGAYAEWRGGARGNVDENRYFEKYAPMFEQVQTMLSGKEGAALGDKENMGIFLEELVKINKNKLLESDTGVYSIVEVLNALLYAVEHESFNWTPTGGTE